MMRVHPFVGAFLAVAFLHACSNVDTSPSSTSTGTSSSSGGPETCASDVDPPPASTDFCARIAAGPSGARTVAVDLSAAHAGVRFFSPIASYADADQALASALEAEDALEKPDLAAYAAALPGVACALPAATTSTLPAASVELVGAVAVVHPGQGEVTIPEGAQAVAVDLRRLPAVDGLAGALDAAVAKAITGSVSRGKRRVRRHVGLRDEVFSADNVYGNEPHLINEPPLEGTGAVDRPIALLTDAVMAPDAAAFAGSLRLAGRAFILGEDVRADVAEARWQGVGQAGVAYRWSEIAISSAKRWPDTIPADVRSTHPECLLDRLVDMGVPPALTGGAITRASIEPLDGYQQLQAAVATLGTARAALVIAHGAARTFFPYFATVGDTIDDRLVETLADLGSEPPADGKAAFHALGRFGNALHDGHNFVTDYTATSAGSFPVFIEDIDGEPVVRRSLAVGVSPGDTITSIGGVPAATWYETELARTSAATDGYRFNIATRRYLSLEGPTAFGLRHADGTEETIDFQPQSQADANAIGFAPSLRKAGPLADLGAPSLYYINLTGEVLSSVAQFDAALGEAATATGLVLDMRGYPGVDHYAVAQRLIQKSFSSPVFRTPVLDGPDLRSVDEGSYTLTPLATPSFAGPIVLLVGHVTVSAAENFSIMLVDAKRVKVMGRRSAATNGNITGVQLPGALSFSFTGMEVRHADAEKSVFHGVGIVPDTETKLTAAAFAAGQDPELDEAIAWLSQQP
ncbi:Peptidase, S41 family protein [Minicystis rosea]|nr:Peptidase, S41 family protein [Minicystis rosea]